MKVANFGDSADNLLYPTFRVTRLTLEYNLHSAETVICKHRIGGGGGRGRGMEWEGGGGGREGERRGRSRES